MNFLSENGVVLDSIDLIMARGGLITPIQAGVYEVTQQMREALNTAAADFVYDLPYGIDTQCFEKGAGLSEGQAQRIAIARALLRPGRILLLDEFSSALDAQTETLLLERLTATRSDRTMIFITHRERVIDYCDATLALTKEE